MKKNKQPSRPATRQRATRPAAEVQTTVLSEDERMFQNVLKALNKPPENNPAVFKAKRLTARRLLRQFRKQVQALAKDFDVHIETLETAIRDNIKSKNPRIGNKTLQRPLPELIPFLRQFDWRDHRIVPRVRQQNADCGSCWAYVTTEAFESSAMKQRANFNLPIKHPSSLKSVAVNAAYTLNCVSGDCAGGRHETAFTHFVDVGIPRKDMVISFSRRAFPRDSFLLKKRCLKSERIAKNRIPAIGWDYVHLPPHEVPPPRELKKALLEYGPLVVILQIDDCFQDYGRNDNTGRKVAPVFQSKTKGLHGNHFVLLIGWDDEKRAWIVQNSFGPKWGYTCRDGIPEVVDGIRGQDRGFMYIRWRSNDIGRYAAWVQAPLIGLRGVFKSIRRQVSFLHK